MQAEKSSSAAHTFRFREVPTFGTDTIGKFAPNVSDMPNPAAHCYEDVLQCAIACFEGLFPEDIDDDIRSLLFFMATWHALAKLRMHSTSSLTALSTTTICLGSAMRIFVQDTCTRYQAKETAKEMQKRRRAAEAAAAKKKATTSKADHQRFKVFNLKTYKFHSLGDYPSCIQRVGTTDSYSEQIVSLCYMRICS